MPGPKPSDRLMKRFFDIDSTDSKLSPNSVIIDDSGKPIENLNAFANSMAAGKREDDGYSGVREALILQSFSFQGINNIPDPKIAGVIRTAQGDIRKETRDLESIGVVIHYGVAAGGTLSMLDPETIPFTMLSRFYEIFDQASDAQNNTFRTGQIARVVFKGTNFGFIETFLDDAQGASGNNRGLPGDNLANASSAFPPPHGPGTNSGTSAGLLSSTGRYGSGGFNSGGQGGRGGNVGRLGNFPALPNPDDDNGVYPGSDMTFYGQQARRTKKPARFSYDMIVLHDGGYGWRTGESAVKSFIHQSKQSAGRTNLGSHYYITKEGTIYALCPESYVTNHTRGDNDNPWWPNSINMRSIGIDLQAALDTRKDNKYGGEGIYTNAQYSALAKVISDVCSRRGIPVDNQHIIGHFMSQANRVDLRYNFDFKRLGIGLSNPLGNDHPQRVVSKEVKDAYSSDDYVFESVSGKWRPFVNIEKTKK